MLVLTRNIKDTICIGDNITVTVLDVTNKQVRIGVDAPKHIAVHREEVYRRIQAEKDTGAVNLNH